ncbi:peptidase M4 [Alcanivorax sp. N3-2A]|nr:peptidase M4 [Alcanivorax sp. N3-2A]|tara:strand:- start:16285 stop:17661 length:1377 start_codon:yes stop_codon:yes gene_type:complete
MVDHSGGRRLYAAVWRWHFYAGLFAAPFLLILSITGAIYLFNDEINDALYPQLRFAPSGESMLNTGELVASVQRHYPNAVVTRIDTPVTPGRTAMAFVTPASGAPLRVFVDPGNARVLGEFVYTDTLVGFADLMHGSLLLGEFGDAVVELAACWTLVLVVTGLYLWWPRRQRARLRHALLGEPGARGRRLWREVHRLIGVYAAALILFLVITGLPWAGLWGGQFLTPISNALGLGYPPQLQHHSAAPPATPPAVMGDLGEMPWTLQQAPLPTAHLHHGEGQHAPGQAVIGVHQVHRILLQHGLPHGYRLTLPTPEHAIYTAITYPDRPQGQRTLQIDAYSGAVIANTGFAHYGAIAKAVEWGVAVHMGNYFGVVNQIVMLATCLAIIALVITGLTLWWRRRPPGGLGAPRPLAAARARNLTLITLALLLMLPLAGASLVLVLIIEALWRRWARRAGAR